MTRISVALDWQVKHARRAEEPGATNKKILIGVDASDEVAAFPEKPSNSKEDSIT